MHPGRARAVRMADDPIDWAPPLAPADLSPTARPAPVLLVLDQPTLVELITLTLGHAAFAVHTAVSASHAVDLLRAWRPRLVVLDMELEGVNGARVLARVGSGAAGGLARPVLALTRRGDLRTKLDAFERGVDDILTLPFAPEELLARALVLVRRSVPGVAPFLPVVRLGELEIDILQRTVRAGAHDLHLSALEQSLLYLLAANAGRVVSREEILDALWGPGFVASSNIVDRQVRNLRTRLRDDWRRPRFIATVPGQGYRFLPTGRDHDARDPPGG
jgi:DNA-binding response OmpR family regulator